MPTPFPTVDEIEQYRPAVTRYIRHLVRDDAEAEDLAQETFLRAHRQISMLHDPAALGGWLYQIASHASIDRLRRKAQAIQRQIDAPVEDLPIAGQDRPSPLTIIQQNEMSDCVRRYVANLSDPYKAVLLFHDVDGLTADEISHLLRLPMTTVKMRLHRARQQLRDALNNACAFERDERRVFVTILFLHICDDPQGFIYVLQRLPCSAARVTISSAHGSQPPTMTVMIRNQALKSGFGLGWSHFDRSVRRRCRFSRRRIRRSD